MFKKLYYVSVVILLIALALNVASLFTTAVHPLLGVGSAFISVILFYYTRYKAKEEIEEENRMK